MRVQATAIDERVRRASVVRNGQCQVGIQQFVRTVVLLSQVGHQAQDRMVEFEVRHIDRFDFEFRGQVSGQGAAIRSEGYGLLTVIPQQNERG